MKRVNRKRSAIAGLVCGLAVAAASHAQTSGWGYLEYAGRREHGDGQPDTSANYATLRLNGSTHLWEPWIAQLNGGIGLTFSDTRYDEFSQDGTDVTGDARLVVFPRSHFPFEVFAERRDSRIEGQVAGPDFSTTSYGLSQTYSPPQGTRVQLQARHTERTEQYDFPTSQQIDTVDDFMTLNLSRAFRAHNVDFRTDLNRSERLEPHRENLRQLYLLRHRYGESAAFTLDNMLTRNVDRTRDGFFDNRIQQTQLTSTAFWRGGTASPLLVTGSVLVAGYETDTTAGSSELGFASGNAGISYQWTPAFTTRVTVTASQRDTGQDRSGATLVKATGIYSPLPLDLAGFAYRWSFTGDLGNRSGDEVVDSPVQEYAAAFGHGLGRSVALAGGVFGASINQQLARFADTAGRTESTLTHTGSLDWSATGQNAATFVRVFGSDTRRHADEDTGFRLVNLQVSRTSQIDRLSSWAGNISAQRSRTVNGASEDVAFTTTSAELSYRHLNVFRVPRLAFTSELRFVNDELAQALQIDTVNTERHDRAWVNRLDYTIGRLELSARLALSEFDGRSHQLLHFMARRHFGGVR